MVAGTAASVGLALMNERGRTAGLAWAPAVAEAAPGGRTISIPAPQNAGALPALRDAITRRLGLAVLIGVVALALATAIPAAISFVVPTASSPAAPVAFGPPTSLRAAAAVSGNWERSNALALPPAEQLGAAVIAASEEKHRWSLLASLLDWAERDAAAKAQASHGSVAGAAVAPGSPTTLNTASGYVAGTVLNTRITIYGCVGPGGGFCGNMASGVRVFEGAAACSSNLPFGTRFTIAGDPTGRVYECLDRGHLPATWVDLFFYDTSAGMAWQSSLGTTYTQITIVN